MIEPLISYTISKYHYIPHIIQTLISFFSISIAFEPEDITGNPPKNMMDRDSSIDSNLSNNTGKDRPARKSTIHDLYASREKHRAKSVKACRATAEQIIQNSNAKISNMDVLFRHEVSNITEESNQEILFTLFTVVIGNYSMLILHLKTSCTLKFGYIL